MKKGREGEERRSLPAELREETRLAEEPERGEPRKQRGLVGKKKVVVIPNKGGRGGVITILRGP